jgi:uncharacterized damage-inducible protein DinB
MTTHELERFLKTWDFESQLTAKLLRSLPADKYDFRPDAGGRSLGELAWHLAEIDAYMTFGIEQGKFDGAKPPGIERPKTIEALAPGYERIHADAVARVRKFKPEDLDRDVIFFDGKPRKASEILWLPLLHHLIHHRGQLSLLCRLAGGTVPGIYGPNREETEAMRARR